MALKQFTYTINSLNKYSDYDTNIHQFDIDIGGIAGDYEYYQVQCTSMVCNVDAMSGEPFFISLTAKNLAERYYCDALPSNEVVLATITTAQNGGGILNSGEGTIFTVKNMRQKQRITLTLRGPDMTPLTTTQADQDDIYIQCDLLFTPII